MAARGGLETSAAGWKRIAQSSQFKHLMRTKKAFILPAFLVFAAYCLLLPLLTAYAPRFMGTKIAGASVTYWYGLSVIGLAWVVVWLYVKAAAGFDLLARDIVAEARRAKKSE
ncbi:MAG: DUF485 domain-containing protein [Terriglobales bacterium]